MQSRAAIPPTLPRANPTMSYWQEEPDEIANLQSTNNVPGTADIVIIGSGISGASIAYDLLSRDATTSEIVMFEARQACSGATGRNGGHTKAASYRSFGHNVAVLGLREAVKIARFEYRTIKSMQAFARQHSIECDLVSCDTVDIIYDQAVLDEGVRVIEKMREVMPGDLDGAARYTVHSASEARERFYCKGDLPGGAISYEAGSVSAYKFVIGILKLCLKLGLNLQTSTPVTSLEKGSDGSWLVKTDRGTTVAKQVVLATNGYTAFIFEKMRGAIVPLRGQITAHRPGSNMPKDGLPGTYSFIYTNGYEYMIPRPNGSKYAGDIVIGGGLVHAPDEGLNEYGTTDDTSTNHAISQYLTATTPRYFGENWGEDDPDGRIRREWTGIMGYSPDGLPFIGEVPGEKGLYISASFQGHGMVLCFLCAKALVHIIKGEDGKDLKEWFPESFRITHERTKIQFKGRKLSKPHDLEIKA